MVHRVEDGSDEVQKPAHGHQYYSVFCASLAVFSIGTILGYASPATFQLRRPIPSTNNTNEILPNNTSDFTSYDQQLSHDDSGFTLTNDEIDWFSSAFSIGALLGGVASAVPMCRLGRRGTMLAMGVPSLVGWLLIGLGRSFGLLFAGRQLTGVYTGIGCVVINTYIAEIASADIRGILGSGFNVMFSCGVVFAYFIGSLTTWDKLAFICIIPPMLSCVLMFFNHESPTHLVAKGKVDQAMKTLQHFRGPYYNVLEELSALERAQHDASKQRRSLADFKRPSVYKPLIIVIMLMVLLQLSGVYALGFNLATIFKSSGSEMSPYGSTVLVAVVQTVVSVPAAPLVDFAGRKVLLIFSSVIMMLCQGCLGLYFYCLQSSPEWTIQYWWWVPIISVMTFIIGFSMGIGPIGWILMGELFPINVRETAASICVAVNWSASFFVIHYFQSLQFYLHDYGVYWLFAGCCAFTTVFSVLFVKETKGKTLHEITAMFES